MSSSSLTFVECIIGKPLVRFRGKYCSINDLTVNELRQELAMNNIRGNGNKIHLFQKLRDLQLQLDADTYKRRINEEIPDNLKIKDALKLAEDYMKCQTVFSQGSCVTYKSITLTEIKRELYLLDIRVPCGSTKKEELFNILRKYQLHDESEASLTSQMHIDRYEKKSTRINSTVYARRRSFEVRRPRNDALPISTNSDRPSFYNQTRHQELIKASPISSRKWTPATPPSSTGKKYSNSNMWANLKNEDNELSNSEISTNSIVERQVLQRSIEDEDVEPFNSNVSTKSTIERQLFQSLNNSISALESKNKKEINKSLLECMELMIKHLQL